MQGGLFQVLSSDRLPGERQAKADFPIEDVSGSLSRASFETISGHTAEDLGKTLSEKATARRFFVSGVVQGVGYRFFAQRAAKRLGVAGYAKNLRDGRVEVFAIATEDVINDFRAQLRRGPAAASVSNVEAEKADVDRRFSAEFSIEYSD